jgi:hypothetical protein
MVIFSLDVSRESGDPATVQLRLSVAKKLSATESS